MVLHNTSLGRVAYAAIRLCIVLTCHDLAVGHVLVKQQLFCRSLPSRQASPHSSTTDCHACRREAPNASRSGVDPRRGATQAALPASGPVYTTKMAVAALAHCFPQAPPHQQGAMQQQGVGPLAAAEEPPIIAAPRHFLQAAMQARLRGQSLQVMPLHHTSPCPDPVCACDTSLYAFNSSCSDLGSQHTSSKCACLASALHLTAVHQDVLVHKHQYIGDFLVALASVSHVAVIFSYVVTAQEGEVMATPALLQSDKQLLHCAAFEAWPPSSMTEPCPVSQASMASEASLLPRTEAHSSQRPRPNQHMMPSTGQPAQQPDRQPRSAQHHQPSVSGMAGDGTGITGSVSITGNGVGGQTGAPGLHKQGAGVSSVVQHAAQADAAGSSALLASSSSPHVAAASVHAGVPTTAAPDAAPTTAAGMAALALPQPVDPGMTMYPSAVNVSGISESTRAASSHQPTDAAVSVATQADNTSTAGAAANPAEAAFLGDASIHHTTASNQPGCQTWENSAEYSQALSPQLGFRPLPVTTAAAPLLHATAGSNSSTITAEQSFPPRTRPQFISTALQCSSRSETAAAHRSGGPTVVLPSRAPTEAAAADADLHAMPLSGGGSQTVAGVHEPAAGCVLDPAKLKQLESLHAAAQAAGLTLPWEESEGEDEDSDSSDSVFSGSGSGAGCGRPSLTADVDEVAAHQTSQVCQQCQIASRQA